MAQTKVKLISDGVIDVDHLASGHGITTDNIGEGSNLYYTDARVSTYLSTNSYATEGYVTTAVSNLVAAAPSTLDTLNELAAALGDDPNFATTVTNSIATKLPLAGGTLTGSLTTASPLTIQAASPYIQWKNASGTRLGYIQHNETDLVMSVDTGDIILDGGNIGIGTSSPAYQLDLSKTAVAVDTYSGINLQASNYGYTIEGGLTQNIGGELIFSSNNAGTRQERVRFAANGYIGIGTDSPDRNLHVVGRQMIDGLGLTLKRTGVLGGQSWDFGIDASGLYVFDNTNVDYRLVVSPTGNIGIGTSSPGYKLHVGGTLFAGVSTFNSTFQNAYTNDGLYNANAFPTKVLTPSGQQIIFGYFDNGAGGYFPRIGLRQDYNAVGSPNTTTAHTSIGLEQDGRMSFKVGASNGTEALTLKPNGNVGIGQGNPSVKLDVNGVGNFTGGIQVAGGTAINSTRRSLFLNSFDAGGGAGIFFRDGFSYNCSITAEDHNGGAADGICISGYDGISFSTGSNTKNEVVRIKGGNQGGIGYVGIGTTSPDSNLHIKTTSGDAKVTIESPDDSDAFINYSGATAEWSAGYDRTAGEFIFAQHNTITANYRFKIRSSGINIIPGLAFNGQSTYDSTWATDFKDVVPTGTLIQDRVYLFTIWTNSFGTPPYYAAASAIITTSQGTNSGGYGPEVDLITAHHVGSASKWQLRMSTAGNSKNGVQVRLLNGPSVSSVAVFIRVTELSDF